MSVSLSAPTGFTASQLVFEDNFSGTTLNTGTWNTFMTDRTANGGPWLSYGGGGSGLGYLDDEYDEPSQVSVNNGLSLTAVRKSITAPGVDANGNLVTKTYPFTSGVVDTYGKMEFDGGYLQISMKQPAGDGSWPALWLLPGSGAAYSPGDSTEIDMQEGGFSTGNWATGSVNPNNVFAYHYHEPDGTTLGNTVNSGINLTSGYNTYAINWVPGQSITWYLNGKQMGQVTSAQAPIPNKPMELIMCEAVGDAASASWRTADDSSTPTMAMQIQDVQLYQAAGNGDTIMGGTISRGGGGTPSGAIPTVSITSSGGTTRSATQTVTGTATPNTTVSVLDGATTIGSATAGSTGAWSDNVALLNSGSNVVTATDTNATGTGTSNAVIYNLRTRWARNSAALADAITPNSSAGLASAGLQPATLAAIQQSSLAAATGHYN